MIPVQEAYADHDRKCSISLRTYIYDSEWRDTKRKSADGEQYYPGDGSNVLTVWQAKDCLKFRMENIKTYGNVVVRSMQERSMPVGDIKFSNLTHSSQQDHFTLWFSQDLLDEDPDHEFIERSASTPHVWNIWAENDDSRKIFEQAVENRCDRAPPPPGYPPKIINYGCIFGHIELGTKYVADICYEKLDRKGEVILDHDGEEIIICKEFISKVVFTAEGKGTRCSHGESRGCREYTVTRSSEKAFDIRQPTLDLILERSPFHDLFGFSVMNQDETFYIDDLMGIRHEPVMKYVKNGPIQFVVEVEQDLAPALVLNCIDAKLCPGSHNHTRTDGRDYPQVYGHGKRGYHTLNVDDYSFTYTISAYNIGTTLEYIRDTDRCNGHRDKLPARCVIELSRVDEGRDCSGVRDKDCNWREDRLLNVTSGTITIHAGPYEPVVTLYPHTIWHTPGVITPDAETGVTARYFGSTESDVLYPERRMRIDGTHTIAIAYNTTHILSIDSNGSQRIQPYDIFLILPKSTWLGFDSHDGNYTTIEPRTMMESEGYGTVRFSTKGIADTMVNDGWSAGVSNATGHFVPYTTFLGGNQFTWLNTTSYVYPEGHHAVPLNITVYDSEGMIKPSSINVTIIPSNDTDRTFKEYIERKVGEEQDDDRITEIVGSYVAINHTAYSTTGQLISHIPRMSHVYLSDKQGYNGTDNTALYNNTSDITGIVTFYELERTNSSETDTNSGTNILTDVFSFVKLIPGVDQLSSVAELLTATVSDPDANASLPLYIGMYSAISPSNITVTADGVTRSWVVLDDYYSEPINIIVNTEHDNDASWRKVAGLVVMVFEPTFGVTTSIYDGLETRNVFCPNSCIVGSLMYNSVLTARNAWNGTATSTYEFDRSNITSISDDIDDAPVGYILPTSDVIIIIMIILAALTIIWKIGSKKWPIYG